MTVPIRPDRPKTALERALEALLKRNDDAPRPNEPGAGRRLAAAVFGMPMAAAASTAPPPLYDQGGQPNPALNSWGMDMALGTSGAGLSTEDAATKKGIEAWHGSPFDFDKFKVGASGTNPGGGQSRGYGTYLTESPEYAKRFRGNLNQVDIPYREGMNLDAFLKARERLRGVDGDVARAAAELRSTATYWREYAARSKYPDFYHKIADDYTGSADIVESGLPQISPTSAKLYHVNIDADPSSLLNINKPLAEQSPAILDAVRRVAPTATPDLTGYQAYGEAMRAVRSARGASSALKREGVPGMVYEDRGSMTGNTGLNNYVIFDPKRLTILDKLLMAMGAGIGSSVATNDPR